MKKIKLSKRLMAVAEYIAPGSCAADIGTDHGYLPVWLVQNEICRRVIAADIRSGPLARAKASASEYLVMDKVQFVLTDGLAGIPPESIDTVVIAGMGGETIIKILAAAHWLKRGGHELIIQPQSKIDVLTMWLCHEGYKIAGQRLAADRGDIYTVMRIKPGEMEKPDDAGLYISKALYESGDSLLPAYIDMAISKLRRALDGTRLSESGGEKEAHLEAAVSELNKMKRGLRA